MPGELDRGEGMRLLDDVAGFAPHPPVVIFTGGDPFMRPDLFELAAHAKSRGIPFGFAPSVTPRLTRETARRMKDAGGKAVSISLDGADAATHEGIRRIDGHFRRTEEAVRLLVDEGHVVQINTTVMRANVEQLAEVAGLVAAWGARIWEVFFLIRVGRGHDFAELTPAENEDVVHFLFDASHYGFVVRTVEAPFFRRVVAQRLSIPAGQDPEHAFGLGSLYNRLVTRLHVRLGLPGASRAQSAGTRDGKGILFVAHDGDVYPAGFLPLRLGNVRDASVVTLYREHPVLKALRATAFADRCGACEFADACGGSRARAFTVTGDPLGEDPACVHRPRAALH
jgi:radical SAM protein